MGRYIIKLKDQYLIWSTIVDAPVTFGMTLDDLHCYTKEEYGRKGLRDLPERLKRVELCGVSSIPSQPLEDLIRYNCAGPNSADLSQEELYTAYCLRQPIRDGWTVPAYEDPDEGEE